MSKSKIILAFVMIGLISFQCRDSEVQNNSFEQFDTKELLGSWKLIPSSDVRLIFENNRRNFMVRDNEKIRIFALQDSRGLRLQYRLEDDSPFAYFLFSEKTKNIWGGVFENKVIRIVKERQIPESILE